MSCLQAHQSLKGRECSVLCIAQAPAQILKRLFAGQVLSSRVDSAAAGPGDDQHTSVATEIGLQRERVVMLSVLSYTAN